MYEVLPVHVMKAYTDSRDTAPFILHPRWSWVVNFMPCSLYPAARAPSTNRNWLGPDLIQTFWIRGKSLFPDQNHTMHHPAHSLATILCIPGYRSMINYDLPYMGGSFSHETITVQHTRLSALAKCQSLSKRIHGLELHVFLWPH